MESGLRSAVRDARIPENDEARRAVDEMEGVELSAGSVAGLRQLRTGLGAFLAVAECEPATVGDAQLILAEIATNAFVHDNARLVSVRVDCTGDEIVMRSRHAGTVAPPAHPVPMPPPSGPGIRPGGRGLAIVDQIVTSRDASSEDGCTTTVVRLAR